MLKVPLFRRRGVARALCEGRHGRTVRGTLALLPPRGHHVYRVGVFRKLSGTRVTRRLGVAMGAMGMSCCGTVLSLHRDLGRGSFVYVYVMLLDTSFSWAEAAPQFICGYWVSGTRWCFSPLQFCSVCGTGMEDVFLVAAWGWWGSGEGPLPGREQESPTLFV